MIGLGFDKLGLPLAALGAWMLLGACTDDDGGGDGDGTETGTETGAPGDGDGDSECTPPPGVFGDCASGLDACMTSGPKQCVLDNPNDPTIAVCGRPCADVCDCWAAPTSGDAPVACIPLAPGDDGTCVLDCSGGQACPTGMECNGEIGSELCLFHQ